MQEKRVKDIMVPAEEYPIISKECTLIQAVRVMRNSFYKLSKGPHNVGHHYVLVYNEDHQLAGLLSFRAVMEAVEPPFLKSGYAVPGFFEGIFTTKCSQEAERPVTEIMIPVKNIILKGEDTLLKAMHIMLENKLNSLPVVNARNRVIGMVRSAEIFQEIAHILITGKNDIDDFKAC